MNCLTFVGWTTECNVSALKIHLKFVGRSSERNIRALYIVWECTLDWEAKVRLENFARSIGNARSIWFYFSIFRFSRFLDFSKIENRNSKIENRKSKFENRNSKIEIRNSKFENRNSKIEHRNSKIEIRKSKIEKKVFSKKTLCRDLYNIFLDFFRMKRPIKNDFPGA